MNLNYYLQVGIVFFMDAVTIVVSSMLTSQVQLLLFPDLDRIVPGEQAVAEQELSVRY